MGEEIARAFSHQVAAALDSAKGWSRYGAFVGLDLHNETIAVAVALPDWTLAPVVDSLVALRSIDKLAATALVPGLRATL
jgi:hypothetical protein